MSSLEAAAGQILTPFIHDCPGSISDNECGAIAAWVQKTALVSMLVSSEGDRAAGYGLPAQEYHALYALREGVTPLPASQFWIGRYVGEERFASVWVTPMVVEGCGLPTPELPQAYVIAVVLGAVLLQGVRFTVPGLEFELDASDGLARFWPRGGAVPWPGGTPADDAAFVRVTEGQNLTPRLANVRLTPWRPATDLPASTTDGALVRLPVPCGKHFTFYPDALCFAGMAGDFHSFVASCECGKAYLVQTGADGAHFKAEGAGEAIRNLYEALPGNEFVVQEGVEEFVFKQVVR